MKTLGLLLALLCTPLLSAAQELDLHEGALIESAEVQGLALDRLSVELRRDIQSLADERLSRARINALAARIESELPDVITAARDVLRPDGRVRVIFLVAPIGDDTGLAENINLRYVVERVEIAGVDEALISRKLRDELQHLVGARLDPAVAESLADRLEAVLPDYDVTRRISRGSEAGKIRVVFNFEKSERRYWIPASPPRAKVVYHRDQGWSGVFDLAGTFGSHLFGVGFVLGNRDDLIEEYSGYWLRAENRKAGTRRLGLALEYSNFTQEWNGTTRSAVAASPAIAPLYSRRKGVQPAVTFAVSPHVRFRAGASVAELAPLAEPGPSQNANAALASIDFDQSWRAASGVRQRVLASYGYRAGSTALGSDLQYRRHSGEAHYVFRQRHNRLRADLLAGGLSGRAPMFERFSLGDSLTLRGWNKYVIAPAGGDRMWHQSIEYAYRNFAYFLDAGSVWDTGTNARVSLSTGVGFHTNVAFVTLAVPLNRHGVGDGGGVKFMMGFRFTRAVIDSHGR